MSFDLNVAKDALQHKLHTVFNNLDFCTDIAGDMIIWGKVSIGSKREKYVTIFLQITRKHNIKVNLDKQATVQDKTSQFLWDHFLGPDDDRVEASNKMSQDTNVRDLNCSFGYGQFLK